MTLEIATHPLHMPTPSDHTYADIKLGDQFLYDHPNDGQITLTAVEVIEASLRGRPQIRIKYVGSNGNLFLMMNDADAPHLLPRKP